MGHPEIVKTLNSLVETCKDGELGFTAAREHARDAALRQVFERHAAECRNAAQELQMLVSQYGGTPEHGGSTSGSMHRGWMAVKGAVTGHPELSILEECERGEDAALQRYREAIAEDLPSTVRMLVERQYEGVKRNHAEIRALRNDLRAAQK